MRDDKNTYAKNLNVDNAKKYNHEKDAAYRNYKDNVFCLLYNDKNNLLDLYNGLNGFRY